MGQVTPRTKDCGILKPRRKKGRPTALTPTIQALIVRLVKAGNYGNVAARWAGISPDTMSRWLHRPGEPYESFRRAIEEADAAAEVELVDRIVRAADADPRHAQWLLARKHPERWAARESLTVAHPDGDEGVVVKHVVVWEHPDPVVDARDVTTEAAAIEDKS